MRWTRKSGQAKQPASQHTLLGLALPILPVRGGCFPQLREAQGTCLAQLLLHPPEEALYAGVAPAARPPRHRLDQAELAQLRAVRLRGVVGPAVAVHQGPGPEGEALHLACAGPTDTARARNPRWPSAAHAEAGRSSQHFPSKFVWFEYEWLVYRRIALPAWKSDNSGIRFSEHQLSG